MGATWHAASGHATHSGVGSEVRESLTEQGRVERSLSCGWGVHTNTNIQFGEVDSDDDDDEGARESVTGPTLGVGRVQHDNACQVRPDPCRHSLFLRHENAARSVGLQQGYHV
jgi:hypothetical protein